MLQSGQSRTAASGRCIALPFVNGRETAFGKIIRQLATPAGDRAEMTAAKPSFAYSIAAASRGDK